MGHHGGLPDGGHSSDNADDSTLKGRLKKQIEDYSAYKSEISDITTLKPPGIQPRDGFSVAFFIRMLFSSLVDADWLDAESFSNEGEQSRGGFADIKTLYEKVSSHIAPFLSPVGEVSFLNAKRTELLKNCLSAAEKDSGLFTLTAPTGSGKTKSAISFAFKHASLHKKRRVIYVAPYNTIIEQNASVFEEMLGAENVLRHYGNYYYDDESEESSNKRYSAENWDFPMITTSSVQFFESLFSHRTSVCRKLHNLSESIIIFDESQMIPTPFLIPCAQAIKELVKNYKCTVLLTTATQVALDKYLDGLIPVEIVANPMALHELLKRNHIQIMEQSLEDDELAELLVSNEQVLCIVNTRRHAQVLFEKLNKCCDDGIYHLSTTLYPAHRTQVLEAIRQRLNDGLPCRVISTSLVEAGVDVDFPVVYRAQAGLDSVVQAAGRCNRNGKQAPDNAIVHVFRSAKHNPPDSIMPNISASELIARGYADLASPSAINAYFNELFYIKGEQELDRFGIMPLLNDGFRSCSFPFREVSKLFKIIEDNTKTVYILFEVPALEKRLHNGERSRELFRALANYSVSLYEWDIKKLRDLNALIKLEDEILTIPKEYYSEHFGVHLSPEGGKSFIV